jgi:hypothetical protein
MSDRQVGLRFSEDQLREFEEMYPWHGSLNQFLRQCLDEMLALSKNQPTPNQLTRMTVLNVRAKSY